MLDSIKYVLNEFIMPRFKIIIPTGFTIQQLRESYNFPLTRDSMHLSNDYGRYAAACVWFKTITGDDLNGIRSKPKYLTEKEANIIRNEVQNYLSNFYSH